MFDRIILWSLRNRIAVILISLALGLVAVPVIRNMPVDVFPEFAPPQVQVQTEVPGFSAKDVENLVTRPIEVVLQGTPDVEQIRSNSSIGLSRITVVFKWGVDVYRARQFIQERLQLVQRQLPEVASSIQLMPVTSAISWLLKFAIIDWSGSFRDNDVRTLVDWDIRNRLMAEPGVASVVAVGGGVKQYQAVVDPVRLRQFGLSFSELVRSQVNANALSAGAFVYPSREEEYPIRVDGRVVHLSDLGKTIVAVRDNQPVRLTDVSVVKFGSEIKRGDGQIDGGPAVIGTVSRLWGADTLETTRNVERVLKEVAENLPKDIELIPNIFRQAAFIETSIENLRTALLHSSLIVVLVLLLFLARWRPTIISLIAIPTSLIGAFLVLWVFGTGINALTLGGLVFAVGEIVDDAIIDVENILRRLRENRESEHPMTAIDIVFEGSREIRNSIVFATLVIAVTFMPIFFLQGIEGRIFRPLAIAYLAAISSSLLVAVTLVPVLCYYLLGKEKRSAWYQPGKVAQILHRIYGRALGGVLRVPGPVMGIVAALLVAALVQLPFLGRSFLPQFHEGNIVIAMTLMPGASLEESLRVGREVEMLLSDIPEIESVAQRAGRSRLDEDAQPVNFSEFDVRLKRGTGGNDGVMQRIRARLAGIPGASINVSQFIAHRMSEILSGIRAQVAVKVYGSDLGELQHIQQEIYRAVQGIQGIVDLQQEPMITVPGVDIHVDRERALAFSLAPGEVVAQVGQALNGATVGKVLEADRTFDIYLRISDAARSNVDVLGDLPITSQSGAIVPLRQIAVIGTKREPYIINRDGGMRRAVVQWNVEGKDLNSVVGEARDKIHAAVELPPGYSIEFGGDYEEQQRATRNILLSAAVAIILMVVLMYQVFGSWPLVVLIMASLPMAMIGGVFALLIAHESLNVSSMIGLVALFGIAMRNGIILVSRFQTLASGCKSDDELEAVAIAAARDRLLPILMTACTATLAVMPLLIGDPSGKELERPLAIVLLGGMFSSTLLNLFVIPSLYHWMTKRRMAGGGELRNAGA